MNITSLKEDLIRTAGIMKMLLIKLYSPLYKNVRFLSSLSKDLSKLNQQDDLLQTIKSATDTSELLEAVGNKNLDHQQVMQSLKSLFNLQRSGNSSLRSVQILKHPDFINLCSNLKSNSRNLELNEIIEALKVLSFLGVKSNSQIVTILLHSIRHQINEVSLGHIVFLDFLLKKFEPTPLLEALIMALPMLLQIQIGYKLDHENVQQLIDLLSFIAKNRVSDKCAMNIISGLTLHGDSLGLEEAQSIAWSLCDMRIFYPHSEKLLGNCMNILSRNIDELPFTAVETTVSKMTDKYMYRQHAFYHEQFFTNSARYIVDHKCGFMRALYLLKKFNRISFTNIPLLDYIVAESNTENLADLKPAGIITIIGAFSAAYYRPQQEKWYAMMEEILKNPMFDQPKIEIPWMKLNLELLSLGVYAKDLVAKVFEEEFLELYLNRENNFLDLIQLQALHQSLQIEYPDVRRPQPDQKYLDKATELNFMKQEFPLLRALQVGFGGENFVVSKVTTKYNHFIDHAIVLDENHKPIEVAESLRTQKKINIEELPGKAVAILCLPKSYFSLNVSRLKGMFEYRINTLRKLIPVATIAQEDWQNLPDLEKVPYILRKTQEALKEKNVELE